MGLFGRRIEVAPDPVQKISALNAAEQAWLEGLLDSLDPRLEVVSELFEEARGTWFAADPGERPDPNALINAVGARVGQVLVDRCGLRWVLVHDSDGSELAVSGEPGDVLVFPLNLVAKRWTFDFDSTVQAVCDAVQLQVRSIHDGLPPAR